MPTLAFEWDNHYYGSNAAGYGWTNDILCILSVLVLLWFARELTDRPIFAGAAAVLFASWHWTGVPLLFPLLDVAMWALLAVGIWQHRQHWSAYLAALFATFHWTGLLSQFPLLGVVLWAVLAVVIWRNRQHWSAYVPVVLAIPLFANELHGRSGLAAGMIGWLPSRTASVMTVFALVSMAAYTRYERISSKKLAEPPPTPLTPPATSSTRVQASTAALSWPWIVVSAVAMAMALASYEQAVMLAPALSGVAFCLWLQGFRPRWGWQALFWGVLAGYLVLRHQIVPSTVSHYQRQQFRHGPGVYLDLSDYILPVAGGIPSLIGAWEPENGLLMLANPLFFGFFLSVAQTAGAVWVLRRRWVLAFTGWALSWGAFFPMAWLKQFPHYHYWPMAMRSLFVVAFGWAIWESSAIALRPRAVQAPPRPVPAPGSLPHP